MEGLLILTKLYIVIWNGRYININEIIHYYIKWKVYYYWIN